MPCKQSEINKLRPKDIIKIDTIFEEDRTYLVLKVGRNDKYIKALPLDRYIGSVDKGAIMPVLDIPTYMIQKYKKIDKSILLFMTDQSNPHILEALASLGVE